MTCDERITSLERRCRRLTAGLVVLLTLMGVGVLAGAAGRQGAETVRARSFEVVDEAGRVRLHLGAADEGYGLVIYDAGGAFRATLSDAPLGAALQLRKAAGGIKLLVTDPAAGPVQGGAGLTLSDRQGRPRLIATVADNQPRLELRDDKGTSLFQAPKPQ